ncbi:MAG: SDR family oxidoreductase [Myxococcales bacterium]|nr:SDR family oxidoreductase [Myxococcales bacterium]
MPIAAVTGASRGLGLAFTRHLVDRGYHVFATARRPETAEGLQALMAEHPGAVTALPLDVTRPEGLEELRLQLTKRGGLDLLVNNAGINSAAFPGPQRNVRLGSLEPTGILKMVEVNAVAPLLITQALVEPLAAAGGKVLLVSSWLGSIGGKTTGGNYGYCASKTTLNMLGRALAFDLKPRGVGVYLFNPGWVQTDMGGGKAPLTPAASSAGMLDAIAGFDLEATGGFYDHDGSPHGW